MGHWLQQLFDIKAKFYWSSATGSTAGDTVEWQLQGLAIGDSDPLDGAFTDTGEVITDTLLANNGTDLQITSATSAITINGTPALGDLVRKAGRTTEYTRGLTAIVEMAVRVNYGPAGIAMFDNQIGYESDTPGKEFSAGGDSGSTIVNESGYIVALLFAGGEGITIANKISDVITLLDWREE